MAVVVASNLRKELAGELLFEEISFTIGRRDRLALLGPNGAGKTTLLRMLAGEVSVDGGELAFAKGTRVALHDQRAPLDRDLSLEAYVVGGAGEPLELEADLRRLEEAMAAGAHDAVTLAAYARAQERFEHAGGYAWRERAAAIARGLGFGDSDLGRRLDTFSGGEVTKASLARSLVSEPDLLLLDEPTNHLDVANLEWLERELQSLDAGVIVVAHDRWFLEAVSTGVIELEAGRSTYFAGPWHAWRREKAARIHAATKSADRIGRDIERLERFVERFRASTEKMARQAQVKLTQIERLEKERAQHTEEIDLLTRRGKRLGFEFFQPARSGRTVVEVEELELAAGEKTLLTSASFALER